MANTVSVAEVREFEVDPRSTLVVEGQTNFIENGHPVYGMSKLWVYEDTVGALHVKKLFQADKGAPLPSVDPSLYGLLGTELDSNACPFDSYDNSSVANAAIAQFGFSESVRREEGEEGYIIRSFYVPSLAAVNDARKKMYADQGAEDAPPFLTEVGIAGEIPVEMFLKCWRGDQDPVSSTEDVDTALHDRSFHSFRLFRHPLYVKALARIATYNLENLGLRSRLSVWLTGRLPQLSNDEEDYHNRSDYGDDVDHMHRGTMYRLQPRQESVSTGFQAYAEAMERLILDDVDPAYILGRDYKLRLHHALTDTLTHIGAVASGDIKLD